MRERIMGMLVGDALGCEIKYKNLMTGKKRTGKIYGIYYYAVKVVNKQDTLERVSYADVLEVVDAKNQG